MLPVPRRWMGNILPVLGESAIELEDLDVGPVDMNCARGPELGH
jgi:hypothetical protein